MSLAPRQPRGCHGDRVAAESYRGDAASVGSRETFSEEKECVIGGRGRHENGALGPRDK